MASLTPGNEYDICISCRHNYNPLGWVSRFIRTLQEELSATLKETISIYFYTNTRYVLLETHGADKSLKARLKYLNFITIISQILLSEKR